MQAPYIPALKDGGLQTRWIITHFTKWRVIPVAYILYCILAQKGIGMGTAIIGCTGFVGGYLGTLRETEAGYSTRNSASMVGASHGLVICAGANALKWKANQDGAADWRSIEALWRNISKLHAERFVLISTVDVYPVPVGVDENLKPHLLPGHHSYGINRLALEELVLDRFSDGARVLRLPGLFGQGLRKNVLFDMAHRRLLDSVDGRASFQWYGLDRLWGDIDRALEHPTQRIFNLAVEPVLTSEVQQLLFPGLSIGKGQAQSIPTTYDMHTALCSWMGGTGGYLENKVDVLNRMQRWLSGPSPLSEVSP